MEKLISASRISELLANGSGKTAQNYILDLALQTIGIKDEINTPATQHGLNNQLSAFEQVVKPLYPNSVWHDEFIPINEFCGSSPDCLDDNIPFDVKCPYYIDTYLEQINSVPTKYYQQVQMQALATGADKCRLVFFLTKPEKWGEEEWNEYPLPLALRHKIFEYDKDEELHELILKKVSEAQPKKEQIIKLLQEASVMDEDQFFYEQISGYAYRGLKDCSNILNLDMVVRVGDKFYYKKSEKKEKEIVKPEKDYTSAIQRGKELMKKVNL